MTVKDKYRDALSLLTTIPDDDGQIAVVIENINRYMGTLRRKLRAIPQERIVVKKDAAQQKQLDEVTKVKDQLKAENKKLRSRCKYLATSDNGEFVIAALVLLNEAIKFQIDLFDVEMELSEFREFVDDINGQIKAFIKQHRVQHAEQ